MKKAAFLCLALAFASGCLGLDLPFSAIGSGYGD